MAEFLSAGVEWLKDKLKEDESRTVTYKRGSKFILPDISATVGQTALRIGDEYGGTKVEWTDRDFLIAAEELLVNSQQMYPERGDQIVEVSDGQSYTYEVMAPGPEQVWRWSDPYRTIMRIHTKEIRQRIA